MINDGNGWKPASEVNAGLRAAQDARAAQSIAPPPPPKPSTASTPSPAPGVMNQAAVDAHWTPERRAASRAEEKRILDERQAKEEKAGLDRATKPKLKTDAEYATEAKRRAQLADIEMWQKAREAAEKMNRGNSFGPGPGMHTDYDADPKTGELIEKTVHSKTGVVISEKRHKSLAYSGQKPFNDQWSKPPAPSTVVGR